MIFKYFSYLILVVLLQSCTIGYSSPKILELISLEEKLLKNYKPTNNSNKKLQNILNRTLNELNLPKDFAAFNIIETGIPAMYTGISKEIYISKTFLKSFSNGMLSKNQFRALLMHELFHKKLRHPNKTLSKGEVYTRMMKPSFKNIITVSAQIAGFVYARNQKGTFFEHTLMFSSINNLINTFSKDLELDEEEKKILLFPFFGYDYTKEQEFIVDKMVVKFLTENNESVQSYIDSLEVLKSLIETTSTFKVEDTEMHKLSFRIEKLRNKRGSDD
jgi:hypothetical protein